MLRKVYIVDAVRSPIGKHYGALSSVRADDLAATVIRQLLARQPAIEPHLVDDVILGCANQAGEDNRNIARMASLLAGLPPKVPGCTVNRLCASGMEAIISAARGIALGEGDIYIAGGVENMSRSPLVTNRAEPDEQYDSTIGWRFINPAMGEVCAPLSMAQTADFLAAEYRISRAEQDEYAHYSQQKYNNALHQKVFNSEIVPITTPQGKIVMSDEHPRILSMEVMKSLKSINGNGSTITLANSSGINDGAAAILLVSEAMLHLLNLVPIAVIQGYAITAEHPDMMGISPVAATRKALYNSNLSIQDIDLVELSEAFAVQAIACIRELNLPMEKVNINGGSIALGNPIGMGATRLVVSLAHEMRRQKAARFGLATTCAGTGIGAAIILARPQEPEFVPKNYLYQRRFQQNNNE